MDWAEKLGVGLILTYIVLLVAGIIGWGMNIYKMVGMCCDASGMLVARVVGIFIAPLGAVLGFL